MPEYAQITDAQEILELQKLAYQSEAALYPEDLIMPLTQTLAEMETDLLEKTVLKVTLKNRIIASVRAQLKEGTVYIGRLIVHPDFQNRGIGSQLLRDIEAHFKNASRFELFTGQLSTRNLYLYRKMGYRAFGTEKISDSLTQVYLEKMANQ